MGKRVKDEDLPRHAEEAERGATLAAWAKAAVERQFGGNLSKAARATGVSRHTLWRLTVQRGTPDEGTITRLARAFGPPPGITLPDRDAAIAEAAELLEEAARLIDRPRRDQMTRSPSARARTRERVMNVGRGGVVRSPVGQGSTTSSSSQSASVYAIRSAPWGIMTGSWTGWFRLSIE